MTNSGAYINIILCIVTARQRHNTYASKSTELTQSTKTTTVVIVNNRFYCLQFTLQWLIEVERKKYLILCSYCTYHCDTVWQNRCVSTYTRTYIYINAGTLPNYYNNNNNNRLVACFINHCDPVSPLSLFHLADGVHLQPDNLFCYYCFNKVHYKLQL